MRDEKLLLSGEEGLFAPKSMNTHLHILEAYTNLYRVWRDEGLKNKQKELIELTLSSIIDSSWHQFALYFDECWQVRSTAISYGHDIEGSWLLLEAAEEVGDPDIIERVKAVSIDMAEKVLQEGIDHDGAF